MRRLQRALLLTILAPSWASAANKLPDSDLLEFLGSIDADGKEWSDYLEGTDLDKAAKPASPAPPPQQAPAQPAKPAPPAARQPEDGK